MSNNLLGLTVRDKITGIEGVVVCQSSYLTGCDRVSIQPREVKDGVTAKWESFDIGIIDVLPKIPRVVLNEVIVAPGAKSTGGPQPNPDRY